MPLSSDSICANSSARVLERLRRARASAARDPPPASSPTGPRRTRRARPRRRGRRPLRRRARPPRSRCRSQGRAWRTCARPRRRDARRRSAGGGAVRRSRRAWSPSASGSVAAEVVVITGAYLASTPSTRIQALCCRDGRTFQGGAHHGMFLGDRPRDRAATRALGLDGVRDRAPTRDDRRSEGRRLQHARARRHRRGVDAAPRWRRSSARTARWAC